MCFWQVVSSGCLDCPNVCSTTFTWDAVYATVSGLGILDHWEHVDVFLNSNVDSLVAILSIQPADLLEFWYCYSSKAAMLVGFLLCTCGLFQWTRPTRYPHDHNQFSSDIKHLQGSRSLELFVPEVEGTMMLWNVSNCLQATQRIFHTTSGISNTTVSTSNHASLNFMTRANPQSFLCLWHQNIIPVLTQPFTCNESKRLIHGLRLKSVTVVLQIMYFCVTSVRSMWH